MRVLILIGATFAAGLLAGSMVWSDGDTQPSRRNDSTQRQTGADRHTSAASHRGSVAGGNGRVSVSRDPSERTGDVATLARDADSTVSQIKSTPGATRTLIGEGVIVGTVRDSAGSPIAGVVVTAIPDNRPPGLNAAGRQLRDKPHVNRPLADVARDAMARELWRRDARRTSTTGADGRYAVRQLADSPHSLRAYHDDYDVTPVSRANRVSDGAVVDFLARPVGAVRVEVKLPEGGAPEIATLHWKSADGQSGRATWSPSEPTVRLGVGTCTVHAVAWLPTPMESEPVEHAVGDAETIGTLVLALKGRRVLTASVKTSEGILRPRRIRFRMRRIENGEEIDPESLVKEKTQRDPHSPTPGQAMWFDIEPGRYVVAAFMDGDRLLAWGTAEVGEEATEIELQAEEPDTAHTMVVKVLGPDGGPLPGEVSFRFLVKNAKRTSTHRAHALQRADGAWLVYFDRIPEKAERQAQLRVGTRQHGGAIEAVRLQAGEVVTFKFDQAAFLKLKLDGYSGSGVEGALYAALRTEAGADGWRPIKPDGTCDLNGVQPGDYQLQLIVRRGGSSWGILSRPIRMRPGEDQQRVALPALHSLRVRWAGRRRQRQAILDFADTNLGKFRRRMLLDNKKIATFHGLAAGTYVVRVSNKRQEVRVPSGREIVLE